MINPEKELSFSLCEPRNKTGRRHSYPSVCAGNSFKCINVTLTEDDPIVKSNYRRYPDYHCTSNNKGGKCLILVLSSLGGCKLHLSSGSFAFVHYYPLFINIKSSKRQIVCFGVEMGKIWRVLVSADIHLLACRSLYLIMLKDVSD